MIIKKLIIISLVLAILITVSFMGSAVLADSSTYTEVGYRMQPLKDKLAAMTVQSIELNEVKFKDLKSHWSRKQVGKLIGLDIVAGAGDGNFKPNDTLQADQFIKMLIAAMGFKPGVGVPYWAQTYIDIAKQYGLISTGEYSNYKKPVTREQMVEILIRAILLVEAASDSKYDEYVIGKILDYPAIADDCRQSVIDGYKFGLVTGFSGKFNPKGTLTRAEAAAVIIRFLDKLERKATLPGPDEILEISDNTGKMIEIYPGAVREYFDVAKAMKAALPKARGYIDFFANPQNDIVFANFYKDRVSYEESILNIIGGWEIDPEDPNYPISDLVKHHTVYNLTVYDENLYLSLFADFTYEVLNAIFSAGADKAIALHDKYMNMTTNVRKWEEIRLNNRRLVAKKEGVQFTVQASIVGKK